MLLAVSSLMHGETASGVVLGLGGLALFGWAAWLDHSRR
jgi:hypothetical protein